MDDEMTGPVVAFWTWMGVVVLGLAAMFAVIVSGR